MHISCPNCLTEYDVPDAALAGRARKLRCGHCGHQWHAAALAVGSEPPPVLPDALADPEPARTFGQPEDDSARAALAAAAARETAATPEEGFGLPAQTGEVSHPAGDNSGFSARPWTSSDPQDRFNALLQATRGQPIETGPEQDGGRREVKNGKALVIILAVLVLAGLAYLERGLIMRHLH